MAMYMDNFSQTSSTQRWKKMEHFFITIMGRTIKFYCHYLFFCKNIYAMEPNNGSTFMHWS